MHRFKNILYVNERDVENARALERALELARANQATLTVLEVISAIQGDLQMAIASVTPNELVDSMIEATYERLEESVRAKSGGDQCRINVVVGRPFMEIIRTVLIEEFDLVVKPTAVGLLGIGALSSTDMHLLRKCPCPVWLIQQTDTGNYKKVLAAVDIDAEDDGGDDLSRQILEMSTSLALAESSDLHIVHAWSLEHEGFLRSLRSGLSNSEVDEIIEQERMDREKWLSRLIEGIDGHANSEAVDYLQPRLHLKKGLPRVIIPQLVAELGIELVVMGTLGRSGISGFFMGNTSEDILKQIDCSVLAIKPGGFVSPVKVE